MAEYCKDCAVKYLGFGKKRIILSKEPELCEGCGQIKPVVVRCKPTFAEWWDALGYRLKEGR